VGRGGGVKRLCAFTINVSRAEKSILEAPHKEKKREGGGYGKGEGSNGEARSEKSRNTKEEGT